MPRTQRWQHVTHSFQSGVLSPSAQDQVDGAGWLAGAADIVNFEVQRDGGLTGRPPFIRTEETFTHPRFSAIEPMGDGTTPGGLARRASDPTKFDIGLDDVHRLVRAEHVTLADYDFTVDIASDDRQHLYQVGLDAPVRAVTWHGCRLRAGRWRNDANDPLNFMAQYKARGATTWSAMVQPDESDPFAWGAFAPGETARDITIPMRAQASPDPLDAEAIRIVLAGDATTQDSRAELTVAGVSALTEMDTGRLNWLSRPYRILSYVVESIPMVAVLTLYGVQVFHIDGTRIGTLKPTGTWYFTARQLRELAWVNYGKSIIMAHRDFPYPLHIRPLTAAQLDVGYLELANVPVQTLEQIQDGGLSFREEATVSLPRDLTGGATGGVGGQQQPTITGYEPPPEALPAGPPVGRPLVPSDTAPIRPEPVVVARELIIEQTRGVQGAPPVQAVTPTGLMVGNAVPGALTVSWTDNGADSYNLWIRTAASYNAAPADDRWQGITAISLTGGTGNTRMATRTTLQDGTALAGGTLYQVAVSAVVSTSESDRTAPVMARVQHPAPAKPGNVMASASSTFEGRMTVTWDAVAGASTYYRRVMLPGSTTWEPEELLSATEIAARSFDYDGLAGSEYGFQVRGARQHAPDGLWSDEATVTPQQLSPPVPTMFRSFRVDRTIIGLSWTKSPGATQYVLRWNVKGATGEPNEIILGDVDEYRHTGLTRGTIYEYALAARKANVSDSAFTDTIEQVAQATVWARMVAPAVRRVAVARPRDMLVTPAYAMGETLPTTSDFNVRYRVVVQGGVGSWQGELDGQHAGREIDGRTVRWYHQTAEVRGLTRGSRYEVQTRPANVPGLAQHLLPEWSPGTEYMVR